MARILVIEDDEMLNGMLIRLLKTAGHAAEGAGDGESGLRQLAAHPFDLIITDLVMPNKEGIETILELRKRDKSVPIIAMSGGGRMGPDGYLELALRCGADYAFRKPFDNEALLGAVRECLSGIGAAPLSVS